MINFYMMMVTYLVRHQMHDTESDAVNTLLFSTRLVFYFAQSQPGNIKRIPVQFFAFGLLQLSLYTYIKLLTQNNKDFPVSQIIYQLKLLANDHLPVTATATRSFFFFFFITTGDGFIILLCFFNPQQVTTNLYVCCMFNYAAQVI